MSSQGVGYLTVTFVSPRVKYYRFLLADSRVSLIPEGKIVIGKFSKNIEYFLTVREVGDLVVQIGREIRASYLSWLLQTWDSSLVKVKLSPEVYWRKLESSEEVKEPLAEDHRRKR